MKAALPDGWSVEKSTDFCLRVADGTHDTPKPTEDGHPLITSKNLKDGQILLDGAYNISTADFNAVNKRSKVDQWDVLFSMIGTVGQIALVRDEPHFAIKNIGLFKSRSRDDGMWLYYYFTSPIGQAALDTFLTGTSQQFVGLTDLRKVPVISPSATAKSKIAAILTAYDDLIETNKRRIALLEKMAEEIYREWFVRMRFPGHRSTKFVKGVPEGWGVRELKECAAINPSSLGRNDRPDIIHYVDIGSVTTNHIGDIQTLTLKESPGRAKRRVQHGDIIWSSVRPANRAYCLIYNPIDNLIVSTGFAVIRPNTETPFTFLTFVVTSNGFVDQMTAVAKGAAYPATSFDDFEKAKLLWPSEDLLSAFHDKCEPLFQQKHNLTEQNRTLTQTRDLLLPRLISGKLSVEDLDIQFPPSMQNEATKSEAACA